MPSWSVARTSLPAATVATAPGSARPRSIPTWCGRRWQRWLKAPGSPPNSSGTDRTQLIEPMASTLDPRTEPSQDLATHDGPVINAEPGRFDTILRPIRAFRLRYVPVVMVYFAYGALGLIDVTRDLWIKESLSFTPSQLAGIGVWLTLPWTVKMVFGELVDTVPIFGSQRKSYVLVGAALMAAGLLILAGTAGRWLNFAKADHLYIIGAMLI